MDGMTIDEEIKRLEKDAEEHQKMGERNYDDYLLECASEHRQLAEWLRELQKWRALRDNINNLCDVDCEYPQYRESGTMCDACPIGTVKEYFEQIFDEEVNADGDSD